MEVFGGVGMMGITILLIVFGLLSRRFERVTHSGKHYIGFFVAALMVSTGLLSRLWHAINPSVNTSNLTDSILWVLLYHGMPAFGLTLAVVVAWRYWSWLLAERD